MIVQWYCIYIHTSYTVGDLDTKVFVSCQRASSFRIEFRGRWEVGDSNGMTLGERNENVKKLIVKKGRLRYVHAFIV
jgi:hypothetical protein